MAKNQSSRSGMYPAKLTPPNENLSAFASCVTAVRAASPDGPDAERNRQTTTPVTASANARIANRFMGLRRMFRLRGSVLCVSFKAQLGAEFSAHLIEPFHGREQRASYSCNLG